MPEFESRRRSRRLSRLRTADGSVTPDSPSSPSDVFASSSSSSLPSPTSASTSASTSTSTSASGSSRVHHAFPHAHAHGHSRAHSQSHCHAYHAKGRMRHKWANPRVHAEEPLPPAILQKPEVTIDREDDRFHVMGNLKLSVPPDQTYQVLADFKNNPRIFRTIESIDIEDEGDHKLLTQHSRWRFLFLSGTFSVKVRCWMDDERRTLTFELAETGFMKSMRGKWEVRPLSEEHPLCTDLLWEQFVQPAMIPPGPLSKYVTGIMRNQVDTIFLDLGRELSSPAITASSAAHPPALASAAVAVEPAASAPPAELATGLPRVFIPAMV